MGPRRTNLILLVALLAALATGGLAHASGALAALPGARRRFTGSLPVAATDPARIPVTQWLDDRVQVLDPAPWWRQPPFPLT